jgi:hypothetical protein
MNEHTKIWLYTCILEKKNLKHFKQSISFTYLDVNQYQQDVAGSTN